MLPSPIYHSLAVAKSEARKQLAVLIDPDKIRTRQLPRLLELAQSASVDYFFLGGSLLLEDQLDDCLHLLRQSAASVPLVLFPGSPLQLSKKADALLFLSLISGRNPEFLIGHHVVAAPYIKASGVEVIATGYILVEGGKTSSATYMSNTAPIPAEKPEIAVCTALAGEMLGLKTIYLDAGSGANRPVPPDMVRQVSQAVSLPLLVGGGLKTPRQVVQALQAGADLIVVGAALEDKPDILLEIADTIHTF
ncbi:MAG: geranylgeranylglyceryl/heptaprenylglyceryl phosphate synthase [Saprospiraceae bacterium]|jgi:phosphoglycerol geranylgeranyltransferase